MRFNDDANLDSSRVEDGGGSGSGGGGGGMSIGLPHIAGGGVIGLIITVVVILAQNGFFGSAAQVAGGALRTTSLAQSASSFSGAGLNGSGSFDYRTCKTGRDANAHAECALVAVENSLTNYWSNQPDVKSIWKPESRIDVFHGSVQTDGCGAASTDAGPFYCPAPNHQGAIYLDTKFYDTIFRQLGGNATTFVQAYVIAHEYGHHIQDLRGEMAHQDGSTGATSFSVHLELQADCFAGMWTAAATTTTDSNGKPLITDLSQQDISEAINATHIVGDDYIEQKMGGAVDESQWTHGSSAEREAWFRAGMRADNDINACDTFKASDLTDPSSIS